MSINIDMPQHSAGFNSHDFQHKESAFGKVFTQYYQGLVYFAFQIINNQGDAEEIVMDSFTKLWNRRADFNEEHSIKAFLYIATRNACFNHLRQAKTHLLDVSVIHQKLYTDDIMIQTEVLENIHREVEALPPACRNVFKLLYFEGIKRADIAGKLGISIDTVDNHRKHAIKLLRTALLKKGIPLLFLYLLTRE